MDCPSNHCGLSVKSLCTVRQITVDCPSNHCGLSVKSLWLSVKSLCTVRQITVYCPSNHCVLSVKSLCTVRQITVYCPSNHCVLSVKFQHNRSDTVTDWPREGVCMIDSCTVILQDNVLADQFGGQPLMKTNVLHRSGNEGVFYTGLVTKVCFTHVWQ